MVDEYCCMSEKKIKGKMTREVSLRKKYKGIRHVWIIYINVFR